MNAFLFFVEVKPNSRYFLANWFESKQSFAFIHGPQTFPFIWNGEDLVIYKKSEKSCWTGILKILGLSEGSEKKVNKVQKSSNV